MNLSAEDSAPWSTRKLGIAIGIAVVSQAVLIFLFSARGDFKPRTADIRPSIQLLTGVRPEWLRLTDPSLFARTHPDGVSAAAWLDVPEHNYRPAEPPDAPAWLPPSPADLGRTFQDYVKNFAPDGPPLRSWQPPAATAPTRLRYPPMPDSQVRAYGTLAKRGIASTPALPSWSSSEILGHTRVQVLVDVWGNPMSAALLQSCGLKEADAAALDIARRMVFGPEPDHRVSELKDPEAKTITGWLVFAWRTKSPDTNGAPNPR